MRRSVFIRIGQLILTQNKRIQNLIRRINREVKIDAAVTTQIIGVTETLNTRLYTHPESCIRNIPIIREVGGTDPQAVVLF